MNRHDFMHNSNIILDQCNTHGVWFDKYELAAAMDFLHYRIDRPSNLSAKTIHNSSPKTIKEKSSKVEYETLEIKDENLIAWRDKLKQYIPEEALPYFIENNSE